MLRLTSLRLSMGVLGLALAGCGGAKADGPPVPLDASGAVALAPTDTASPPDVTRLDAGGADVPAALDVPAGADVPTGVDVPAALDVPARPDAPASDGGPFATATPLTVPTSRYSDDLGGPGRVRYYSFTAAARAWMLFTTEVARPEDTTLTDTVLTLFDASGRQIAENDDGLPRTSTYSVIYTRIPAAGTYYLRVQDYNTWRPTEPQTPRTNYDFQISLGEFSPSFLTQEVEGNDSAASATPMAPSSGRGFAAGVVGSATDVDVFRFVGPPDGSTRIFVQPAGPNASGSTAIPLRMRVTDATGTTTLARMVTSSPFALQMPTTPSLGYLVWLEPPATLGADPFYILDLAYSAENPAEAREAANNLAATAEPLTMNAGAGFILATLGDGDVDHYSFPVAAGQVVGYTCGSRTNGSGVVGLQTQLVGPSGAILATGSSTESDTQAATRSDVAVPTPGTYSLRLSKNGQDAEVRGNWVRCGVTVRAP